MAGPIRIAILGNATSAVAGINKTAAATTTLGTRFKATAAAAAKFAALGLGVAVAGAAYAAVKFAQAAAEDQQSAALMAKSFRNAANATDAQIASTEKWITAQGRALGVTDDELRPALSRLVTVTGDVNKAQSLASLAMNVSAGTGKSLESVTTALAKAQNGSLGGLARLGVATKNADGSTKSLAQVTDDLAKKFGGAATAKANTFQGQLDRLKLIASEAGESLGAKLLPILTRFATFMLSTGIPAITKFGAAAKEKLTAAFDAMKPTLEVIGTVLAKVFGFLNNNRPVVIAFAAVLGVGAIALTVFGAAMALVNAVLLANPIVLIIVGLAALAAGLTYAYKRSETFRAVVDKAFSAVKAVASVVLPVVAKLVTTYFGIVRAVTTTVFNVVKTVITTAFNVIRTAFTGIKKAVSLVTGAWEAVKEGTRNAWQRVVELIGEKITAFMTKVKDIKTKVTGAFDGAGTWLYDAGKAVIQGLLDGLNALWEKLKAKWQEVKNLIDKIPGVGRLAGGATSMTVNQVAYVLPPKNEQRQSVTIHLTAEQFDQLSRGRQLRADLDLWDAVGGRKAAVG